MKNTALNFRKPTGFTIVELLIVIVVIGILAAITIVSYSGISNKAIVVSLQSDLDNDSRLLKMYNVEYGYYPDAINIETLCPILPTADDRYCLKVSTDNSLVYTGGGQNFVLTVTNSNGKSYEITESLAPYDTTAAPATPITAIADITGILQISQTLTAGDVTPSTATVTYQWQSAATSGGVYTDIPGATSNAYTVSPGVMNRFIKVTATGIDSYTGSQTSAATSSAIAVDSNWLAIGTQVWAKANVNVGTMVDVATTQTNNAILEKYCYNGNEANCTTYGGLYQWDEAMQYVTTEGSKGICPTGSHIPSDNDWKILEVQLGMTQLQADSQGWRGTNQGTQLKTGGGSGLNIPLSGYRNASPVSFGSLLSASFLWTSSDYPLHGSTWYRILASSNATMSRSELTNIKVSGFSVRCLGD